MSARKVRQSAATSSETKGNTGRKSVTSSLPSQSAADRGEEGSSTLLQQELETLRQVHSSIKALHHLSSTLHNTLESVVTNSNELKDLNEGWQIFFGQTPT